MNYDEATIAACMAEWRATRERTLEVLQQSWDEGWELQPDFVFEPRP